MSMTEHQFRQLLDRYLSGEANEEEVKLLDQFFDSYRKNDSDSDFQLDPALKQEILGQIKNRIKPTVKFNRQPVFPSWLKIAASISVVLVASYFFIQRSDRPTEQSILPVTLVSEQTSRGVKSIIELPDGTRVHLNSKSSISYPQNFTGNTREVILTGEAYFDVQHDENKPFLVRTANATTQVLGTSFNVKTSNDKIEVTLVRGKVNVMINNEKAVLNPNQQAVISTTTNTIKTQTVDVSKYIGWKDNILNLEAVRLKDAVVVLEEWYNVDITISSPSISNCIITAKYQNESLENVLKSIQFLLNAKIVNREQKISISGNGCK